MKQLKVTRDLHNYLLLPAGPSDTHQQTMSWGETQNSVYSYHVLDRVHKQNQVHFLAGVLGVEIIQLLLAFLLQYAEVGLIYNKITISQ